MTHDCVHRTHLEIFPTYHPPVLAAWYMDGWATHAYGNVNACMLRGVEVVHNGTVNEVDEGGERAVRGRRYDVDHEAGCFIEYELMAADKRISDWSAGQVRAAPSWPGNWPSESRL